jgi:hypothetical protein
MAQYNLLQWCQKSARSHFFPESDTDFNLLTFVRAIKKKIGREKIYFLSSRKYTWRVDVFNGMLIYLGSYLSHLFPRLKENAIISVILDFHIMDPTPLPL